MRCHGCGMETGEGLRKATVVMLEARDSSRAAIVCRLCFSIVESKLCVARDLLLGIRQDSWDAIEPMVKAAELPLFAGRQPAAYQGTTP